MSIEIPENFLDIVHRTMDECGIPTPTSVLTTVVGQTGEPRRFVGWCASVWLDIQRAHQDWDFMRAEASWVTISGQAIYTPVQCGITAGTHRIWARDTFRNFLTSGGTDTEVHMGWISYDAWRDTYRYGATRSLTTQPRHFSITPAKAIAVGPFPNGDYTVTGDYWLAPVKLTLDADVPNIQVEDFMVIVYGAMMKYGRYESAPEVYQGGLDGYNEIFAQMTADRMPDIVMGGALA